MPGQHSSRAGTNEGLGALGLAVFAIACCAAFPLVAAALAGSIALGAVLGIGAGAIAIVAAVSLIVLQVRRRRACEAPSVEGSRGRAAKPLKPS